MKRIAAIALIALAGFCTAGSLQAQTHEVRANIPFDFTVGSKVLPAGNYRFYAEPNDIVLIRNSDRAEIAVLSRNFEADRTPVNVSQLVFNRYGDQYFLSGIECTSIALNLQFPQSKREKQISTQRAWLGPEQVLVAMN